jgi:hypothetical protein
MGYNVVMNIKNVIYTILVIIVFLFFSCKKETSNNSIPKKIISNIEYNEIADNIISDKILPDTNFDEITNNIIPEKTLSDDEWYEMEQNERKNYLLNNNDLTDLGIISSNEFVERHGEENILQYFYYSEWNDDVIGINYIHSKELFLVKLNENEYYVLINQYLIPFSEEIILHTIARINNNIFIFKTLDGWDNVIVGNFYFEDNNVLLKIDCEKSLNLGGKNHVGRQYGGDIYVLKKRIIKDISLSN